MLETEEAITYANLDLGEIILSYVYIANLQQRFK